jgi:hypothetical protein
VFVSFLALNFLVVLVIMQHMSTLPIAMSADGLSPATFGWVIAVNGLMIVAGQLFVPKLIGGHDRSRVLALATLIIGVGFGLNAFAGTAAWFYALSVVIWTLGEMLQSPSNSALIAELSPACPARPLPGGELAVLVGGLGPGPDRGRLRAAAPGQHGAVAGLRRGRRRGGGGTARLRPGPRTPRGSPAPGRRHRHPAGHVTPGRAAAGRGRPRQGSGPLTATQAHKSANSAPASDLSATAGGCDGPDRWQTANWQTANSLVSLDRPN